MKKKAFTLIELLVVIAVIALLLSILLPALRKVREQARRKSCAARIRQMVMSSLMYADDNNAILPRPTGLGNWLQDVSITVVHYMLDTGMTQDMFYCPSNATHEKDRDALWTFANNSWNGRRFTNYNPGSFIVSGYLFITQGAPDATQRQPITRYDRDPVEPIWLENSNHKQAALRELIVDNTIGTPSGGSKYGFDFAKVSGGLLAQGIYDRTSHLKDDYEPWGHNNGYLDGHVEWKNFDPQISENTGNAIPRHTFGQNFFW